jgi:DNA modification methylase
MEIAAKTYKPEEALQIINDDFYSWCNNNLEDASISLILTDPPYPKEYLYLWEQLAEVAERVLKPGGYLATYSGQLYLNRVMSYLDKHLTYVWTIGLQHTGATQLVNPRTIVCSWKPILLYKKPIVGKTKEHDAGKIISASGSALVDFIGDDYREKDFHYWGQGESAVGYLMKTLSYPGDLVLDPFVGGGTTLVVAKDLMRRCIGIEIDKQYIPAIKSRLNSDKMVTLF